MSFTRHETPALDPQALDELRACDDSGDGSLIAELIELYLLDTPRRLALLRDALAEQDASALAHEAHALKGSCAQFGATTLAALCRELEALGRRGEIGSADELLAGIEREFERVKAALEQLRTH